MSSECVVQKVDHAKYAAMLSNRGHHPEDHSPLSAHYYNDQVIFPDL